MDKNLRKVRPPTKQMIEFLMECHERELMNLSPFEATKTGVKGLIDRQFISTEYFRDETGKRYLGVFITENGRKYLEESTEKKM